MRLSKEQDNPEGVFIDFEVFMTDYQGGKINDLEKCQNLKSKFPGLFAKNYKSYSTKIFFTHRWDDEENPDIRNWQIEAIYQYGVELQNTGKFPACFWYDYCSLPQNPRTCSEKKEFDEGLKHVNLLCRTCVNVPLISNIGTDALDSMSQMLKRGWILVELFISSHSEKICNPLFEGDFDYVSGGKYRRLEWSNIIPNLMDSLPFDSPLFIHRWFDLNNITCTNGSDLKVLSERLFEHIYSYVKEYPSPPELTHHEHIIMSCEEVSAYYINKFGVSALFSNTYFETTYIKSERKYIVSSRYRPPLICLMKWKKMSKNEFFQFEINEETMLSPKYNGVFFKVKKLFFWYFVKATFSIAEGGI